jgi:hypothetical protein
MPGRPPREGFSRNDAAAAGEGPSGSIDHPSSAFVRPGTAGSFRDGSEGSLSRPGTAEAGYPAGRPVRAQRSDKALDTEQRAVARLSRTYALPLESPGRPKPKEPSADDGVSP